MDGHSSEQRNLEEKGEAYFRNQIKQAVKKEGILKYNKKYTSDIARSGTNEQKRVC